MMRDGCVVSGACHYIGACEWPPCDSVRRYDEDTHA